MTRWITNAGASVPIDENLHNPIKVGIERKYVFGRRAIKEFRIHQLSVANIVWNTKPLTLIYIYIHIHVDIVAQRPFRETCHNPRQNNTRF